MHPYADDVTHDTNDTPTSNAASQAHLVVNLSPPSLCSYLPDRASQLHFILLESGEIIDPERYTELCQQGFRRSGQAFYRPNCPHCQQCISSRVVVNEFEPSRRYRKILNRNAQVSLQLKPAASATHEHYALYQKYISARHADGDMYPPSLHTFEQFLVASPADTLFLEFREPNNKLIAVAVTDRLSDGLSAIYTFFDPDPSYNSRSLGVYCILQQIKMTQRLGLAYAYLGFWIPTVQKMRYKTNYAPIELLIHGHWQYFESAPTPEQVLELLATQPLTFNN